MFECSNVQALNRNLFNGLKFRLHDAMVDGDGGMLTLKMGVTDYKDYLGTVSECKKDPTS